MIAFNESAVTIKLLRIKLWLKNLSLVYSKIKLNIKNRIMCNTTGKMILVRIIENTKIDAFFKADLVN